MSDENTVQNNLALTDGWSQVLVDPDIREAGGEHNNEGVDFSRYWAISAMIERELDGASDYVILFEYLQDVAVLDSAGTPANAVLYQLKKKERGSWTRTELCKKDTAKPPDGEEPEQEKPKDKKNRKKLSAGSPIGKLYLCVDRLSQHVSTSGVFLSNAPISLKLTSGETIPSYSKTSLSQLHEEDFEYLEGKIASELGMERPLSRCTAVLVEQTRITPAAMREIVLGIVSDYLREQHPTLPNVSGQIVERLINAFSARSGPQPSMNSLAEIVAKKGFTRSDFTGIIGQASASKPFTTRLEQILECLLQEGVPSRKLNQLRNATATLQTQLVRHPSTKEAMRWDDAVNASPAPRFR